VTQRAQFNPVKLEDSEALADWARTALTHRDAQGQGHGNGPSQANETPEMIRLGYFLQTGGSSL
jgi:hypothetical protein